MEMNYLCFLQMTHFSFLKCARGSEVCKKLLTGESKLSSYSSRLQFLLAEVVDFKW